MHHVYNAYTTAVLEALVQKSGYELPMAKAYIRDRMRLLYHSYLNSVPPSLVVDEMMRK